MTDERKQAEEILLDVFEMGMAAQEIGMPSFDMIKQTGSIDKMIDNLFSLKVAEATKEMYPKAFIDWATKNCYCEEKDLWLYDWSKEQEQFMQSFTTDELFEYWKQNIRK